MSTRTKRTKHRGASSKRRRPAWIDTLVVVVGVVIAIALMVWPWVLDQLSSSGAFSKITEVESQVSAMSGSEIDKYFKQARAYNEKLAGEKPEIAADKIWSYDNQLTYQHDPMMSWLEIPTINVSMPIYHGTSESTLMVGVGHLQGTSLPVGGKSTHVVLTAHSGMQNLTMFDDIGQLRPGDLVLFHTMNETLAYRMESSEVVWPDEVSSLEVQQGRDLVTLVTCTPYGVNDHRLLVHCVRTEYNPAQADDQRSIVNRHWGMREWAILVAALALLGLIIWLTLRHWRRKRHEKAKALPSDESRDT